MQKKLKPEPEILPPLTLEDADVTEDDVKVAIADWKNKPPDDEFRGILEAEIIQT